MVYRYLPLFHALHNVCYQKYRAQGEAWSIYPFWSKMGEAFLASPRRGEIFYASPSILAAVMAVNPIGHESRGANPRRP